MRLPINVYELAHARLFHQIFLELWEDRPWPDYDTSELKDVYAQALQLWYDTPLNSLQNSYSAKD